MRTKYLKVIFLITITLMMSLGIEVQNISNKSIFSSEEEVLEFVKRDLNSSYQEVKSIDVKSILASLLNGSQIELELFGTQFIFSLQQHQFEANATGIYFFRGGIRDNNESYVVFTLDESRLNGYIIFRDSQNIEQTFSISHISTLTDPKINRDSPYHIIRHVNKINYYFDAGTDQFKKLNTELNSFNSNSFDSITKNKLNFIDINAKINSLSSSGYYAKVKLYGDKYYYNNYGNDPYFMLTDFNAASYAWSLTSSSNIDIDIDLKSWEIWDSIYDCYNCYYATSMSDLLGDFKDWGISNSIFGSWNTAGEDWYWTGDTDFAHLYTGKDWSGSEIGNSYPSTAGLYHSDQKKYSLTELYPGLYREMSQWAVSHEWGHLFSGGHEATASSPGSPGYRAYMWCDGWIFWGNCIGQWRQTNMWSAYVFAQSVFGGFSRAGINGATGDTNNAYYIRLWRNYYTRYV